jgi:superfamily I DNA/RNA helicase
MFAFVQRPEFSTEEQEVLTLFALLVRPDAPLHIRAYIGLGDADYFAEQVKTLKERYGDIVAVFNSARADDFPKVQRNLRALCESIVRKRERLEILRAQSLDLDAALDVLMPTGSAPTAALRAAFMALKEPDDTLDSLYGKFIDQMRTIPSAPNTVRVMSLMASKGLDVAHAYIIGCNEGNLPGVRRSEHLTDAEHIAEQLRFLYVGVTRARESVTISWSQYIPYAQALSHNTPGAGNIRIFGGVRHQQVNLCRFLQALRGIAWE